MKSSKCFLNIRPQSIFLVMINLVRFSKSRLYLTYIRQKNGSIGGPKKIVKIIGIEKISIWMKEQDIHLQRNIFQFFFRFSYQNTIQKGLYWKALWRNDETRGLFVGILGRRRTFDERVKSKLVHVALHHEKTKLWNKLKSATNRGRFRANEIFLVYWFCFGYTNNKNKLFRCFFFKAAPPLAHCMYCNDPYFEFRDTFFLLKNGPSSSSRAVCDIQSQFLRAVGHANSPRYIHYDHHPGQLGVVS